MQSVVVSFGSDGDCADDVDDEGAAASNNPVDDNDDDADDDGSVSGVVEGRTER